MLWYSLGALGEALLMGTTRNVFMENKKNIDSFWWKNKSALSGGNTKIGTVRLGEVDCFSMLILQMSYMDRLIYSCAAVLSIQKRTN